MQKYLRKLLIVVLSLLFVVPLMATPAKTPTKATATIKTTANSKAINNAPPRPKIPAAPAAPISLWQYIREHFTLDHETENPRVKYYIYYYQTHTTTLEAVLNQAQYYLYPVVQDVRERNMPMELALLPIIESGFRPYIISEAGASGIWQLMPDTAERFKINMNNRWFDGRADINESTDAALAYLQYLYGLFNNDWLLAVAAYNSGEGSVKNAINNHTNQLSSDFWSLQLPLQTQDYVPKLLAVSAIVANPERYGIYLPTLPNKPLTGKILLDQQFNLDTLSQLANINREILDKLNPGFLQSATPPKGYYYVVLPVSHLLLFEVNLNNYLHPRPYWSHYQIQAEDTLQSIALKTKTSVASLQKINKLNNQSPLKVGEYLLYHASYKTKIYIVKVGESIASIASKFDLTPQELTAINHLPSNMDITPGTVLVVST